MERCRCLSPVRLYAVPGIHSATAFSAAFPFFLATTAPRWAATGRFAELAATRKEDIQFPKQVMLMAVLLQDLGELQTAIDCRPDFFAMSC